MRALACLLLASVAHASPARVAHLEAALGELRATDAFALERAVYEAIRKACGASPKLGCMIETARRRCTGAACDVIVTNLHAERGLLDEPTRIRIVRTTSDFHAATLAELRQVYAVLAAELVLSPPAPSLAAQIDRFCVERDRVARRCAPNAKACVGTIAYQRCAAGLVWFVATERPR
jgi:hypothetical protein